MIISDMRYNALFQSKAFSGQSKGADSSGGVSKSRSEPVQENLASISMPKVPRESSLARLVTRVDALKESLDKILISFPPFFPIGTYQRLDMIMEIKGIQEEIYQLAGENKDLSPFVPKEQLNETSEDGEIMGALQGMFQFRAEANTMVKKHTEANPLSIKI